MNIQTNSFVGMTAPATHARSAVEPLKVELFDRPSDIEREWRMLEAHGTGTVFQRYDWVDCYVSHVLPHEKARPAIVLGRIDTRPAFILPLAISNMGPARIASWIGGRHSGYNFGLWSREGAAAMARLGRRGIERMLGTALPDADGAVLGRIPKIHEDMVQPLAALPALRSMTEGYSFRLPGDFDAVLARCGGAGRRRKIRSKERKMAGIGPVRSGSLHDSGKAGAALDFFYEQKALRLAEQGLPNSFAAPGVAEFFRDLLDRSDGMREPLLEMAALSVDGRMRAVMGSGIHHGRVNVYFMTFARDELVSHSPGAVLTFRHIEECCERGMAAYDLGVGHEDYKSHWCDVVHELNDAYAAFTPVGAATVATLRLGHAVKNRMRRNTPLWQHLKTARAYLSRRTPS